MSSDFFISRYSFQQYFLWKTTFFVIKPKPKASGACGFFAAAHPKAAEIFHRKRRLSTAAKGVNY